MPTDPNDKRETLSMTVLEREEKQLEENDNTGGKSLVLESTETVSEADYDNTDAASRPS